MDDSWKAREEGKRATHSGENPYPRNTVLWLAWVEGHIWQKVHYGTRSPRNRGVLLQGNARTKGGRQGMLKPSVFSTQLSKATVGDEVKYRGKQ